MTLPTPLIRITLSPLSDGDMTRIQRLVTGLSETVGVNIGVKWVSSALKWDPTYWALNPKLHGPHLDHGLITILPVTKMVPTALPLMYKNNTWILPSCSHKHPPLLSANLYMPPVKSFTSL